MFSQKISKNLIYFLVALFVVSFILRSSISLLTPMKFWDETIYVNLGRNLVIYGEYSFAHGFADFSPSWPLAGFRPPLLPFLISFFYLFFKNTVVLNLIVPFISSTGVVGLFFLSKKMFNQKVAVYASVIFAFLPENVYWGSKILTDTVLITMAIFASLFFWMIFFEDKKKYIYSLFFGVFCALGFYSRYSFIWFFPVFFVVLLIKYKNLSFLRDKRLWASILVFLILVVGWFIYNYLLYGEWLGFLIQANEALLRWGTNSVWLYFTAFIKSFWLLAILLCFGLFLKEKKFREGKMFMLVWFLVAFLFVCIMGHKESRYLLIIAPALIVLASVGICKFKKYSDFVFIGVITYLAIFSLAYFISLDNNREDKNDFFSTMEFIKQSDADYVVTEHFSPLYYYTLKKNIRVNNYTATEMLIKEYFNDDTVYYYYVEGDWFDLVGEHSGLDNYLVYSRGRYSVFDLSHIG